ncbi:unnamed protein product [Diabrotica balteata]|uniref:Uncharacterized protein n=1 Tax=Diabrotica balteata TaxID=107213 RepID=A0A9N9SQZ1_DIABA|nr:unnamed protein product [Diabrotica balteata]
MNRGQTILALAQYIENKVNVNRSETETKTTNISRTLFPVSSSSSSSSLSSSSSCSSCTSTSSSSSLHPALETNLQSPVRESTACPVNDTKNDEDEENNSEFSSVSNYDRTYQPPTKQARRRLSASSCSSTSSTDGVQHIPRSGKKSANMRRAIVAKNLRNFRATIRKAGKRWLELCLKRRPKISIGKSENTLIALALEILKEIVDK